MRKRIYYLIISIFFFLRLSFAQQQQDLWTTFTTADGLVSNSVYDICESSDGTIWFGTNFGVSLYKDGIWTTFTTDDGLASNRVLTMIESSDGAMWIGTYGGGVSCYKDGIWLTYTKADGLSSNYIIAIFESQDKTIWFGTEDKGICGYQDGKWLTFTEKEGLASNSINAVFESRDKTLWCGTNGNGLAYYQNGVWYQMTTVDGLANDSVSVIYESKDGALWIGTFDGLSRYQDGNWTTFSESNDLPSNIIGAIYESSDGTLWIATSKGVGIYRFEKWTSLTIEDGLVTNLVTSIIESNDEAMWFATIDGVSRYEPGILKTFTSLDGLPESFVVVFRETSDGSLWCGTAGGGVVQYKNGIWTSFSTEDDLLGNTCFVIYESNDGATWFSIYGGGISRYKDRRWTNFTSFSGLTHNVVQSIYQSRDGAMWFGTAEGISKYLNGIWSKYTVINDLPIQEVYQILESRDGALWFATYKGVCRFQNGIWTTFPDVDDLANKAVKTILETSEGALWFGVDGGVRRYQDGVWTTFTEADGLIDNYVLSVVELNDSSIWIGTFNGVSRYQDGIWTSYNPAKGLTSNLKYGQILASSNGSLWVITTGGVCKYKDSIWTTFTKDDGISNYVISIYEAKDKSFWLGTFTDGVIRIKPDNVPPSTSIIQGTPKIIGTSTPMFVFTGKDYRTKQNQLEYFYTVLDSNGIVVSGDYSVFFKETAIQPFLPDNGTYTFSVGAKDNWGNIDPTPATRTFTVDITQPTAVIEYPAYNDTLSQIIPIIGYTYDDSPIKDFEYFSIYYGKGTEAKSVTEWKTLVSNNKKEIRNDTLAIWDASGLRGTYQLKLFAKDTLDHISEDIVSVHIVDATQEIKARQGGCIVDALNNIELCFPPNSFPENIEIKISNVEAINLDSTNFKYMGLCYDIMPKDLTLKKPATLILSYTDSILINVSDLNNLNICRYDEHEENWIFIGGTVNEKNNQITTSITQLGRYGLFESFRVSGALSLSEINCQPRMFSPRGGGYSTETNISFYLGKDSNVTIKIFNMAGRLVNILCENKFMTSGMNNIAWDGMDSSGRYCISGLYVVLIQAEEKSATKTVMVLNK